MSGSLVQCRKSVFLLLLLPVIAILIPCLSHAGGTLYLQKKAVYEKGSPIPDAVRKECGLETKIVQFVEKFASKNFDKIVLVENASAAKGKVLAIRITGASATKGGTTTGPKSLTIKGTLSQGGNIVGTFTASRFTTGGMSFIGYKGTCSMLGRCAKALGKDVANWLEKPTMNAKLGDAK